MIDFVVQGHISHHEIQVIMKQWIIQVIFLFKWYEVLNIFFFYLNQNAFFWESSLLKIILYIIYIYINNFL